jgi:hypothetical protein|tara:strand:- start:378 stop:719 length:342 start_codon:yes stop_codon:yes gene_type:complete
MEPLSSILKIYNNKQETLLNYLPETTIKFLNNTSLYHSDEILLYLNDMIFCVKKETGKITEKGKIICIDNDILTIMQQKNNVNINSGDYYIFVKNKKNKKNDREFFKELLKQL